MHLFFLSSWFFCIFAIVNPFIFQMLKQMNHFRTLLLAMLLSLFFIEVNAGQYVEDSIKVDGKMRKFVMYLPDGLQADAPLVVVLHGYGAGIRRENIMIGPADKHGFAVCIPQGLKDPQGEPSWNVGYSFQQGWKVDDVKALCEIARYARKRHHLHRRNIFLTGMSNGGEMCYLMAYSNQYTFRAVAPIAGLTMQWMYDDPSRLWKSTVPRIGCRNGLVTWRTRAVGALTCRSLSPSATGSPRTVAPMRRQNVLRASRAVKDTPSSNTVTRADQRIATSGSMKSSAVSTPGTPMILTQAKKSGNSSPAT